MTVVGLSVGSTYFEDNLIFVKDIGLIDIQTPDISFPSNVQRFKIWISVKLNSVFSHLWDTGSR